MWWRRFGFRHMLQQQVLTMSKSCSPFLSMRHSMFRAAALSSVLIHAAVASAQPSTLTTRMVDMGGHSLRIRTSASIIEGRPTVVFESGLGTPLENWNSVQREIAVLTATVSYDRAGLGGSGKSAVAPTIPNIVAELRTLLQKTGARPPYVLVGHSLGGAVIRLFAAQYPSEVAGLVFVDPAGFTQSVADQDEIFREIDVPNGREQFNRSMLAWYRRPEVPEGVRAEAEAFAPLVVAGFPEFRSLPPLPDVPAVMLLAGKYEPPPDGASPVPGGPEKDRLFHTAWVRQRLAQMSALVAAGKPGGRGSVVLTSASGHYIQSSEPGLVTWWIRWALFPDPSEPLANAALRGGADSALVLYTSLRRTYPESLVGEATLNSLGYALLRSGKLQDALAVFQRNVAEYPNASNPHDSLGEAYMAIGNRAKAIEHYERSLTLNPANENAAARLKTLRGR
jgi:pimeloyl-ACP methyl ester carboxylesterase